jgi:hypothetical protein
MRVVVSVAHGDYQQPVLLASVAVYNRRTMISARLIRPEHFFGEGMLKIYHQVLIKLEITH